MELTTKFNLGDTVWHVWNRLRNEVEKCSVCKGAGQVPVVGVGDLVKCPKCWGKGELESGETYTESVVNRGPLTIGQVQVTERGPDEARLYRKADLREEAYMCWETGVMSGTVYRAADLFATREEAEDEARLRTITNRDRIVRYDEILEAESEHVA